MIKIELFDGTALEFPEGTSQTVIDRVAKQETMSRRGTLRQAAGTPTEGYNPPERTTGQWLLENVIGSGAVDTPGERAGELIRGVAPALSRGAMELVGLPGTLSGLLDVGAQRLGLMPENMPPSPVFSALSGAGLRRGASALTGGETEYVAPGRAGQFVSTGGEFMGGGLGGGVRNAVRFGLAPGLASEAAGQTAEAVGIGETGQSIARIGTALGAGALAARPGAFVGGDEASRMANVAREAGVDVSTGQGLGSQALMRMEGRLQPTEQQLAAVTEATMRRFGSPAKVATPTNLAIVEKNLVDQMDSAVAGASIIPNTAQAATAVDVAANYVARVPAGQLTPRVRGIANEIRALANAGKDVPLSRLKTWRSDIGALTVSPDAATREAAHALRTLLDDMTDTALTAANRQSDIASLANAREAYRDYIGVRDAASRAGAEGGILSPQALNQSMIRAQGREAYATGRSTPMTDFTRSAAATLRPAPATLPGGVRSIAEALPAALGAAGAGGAIGAGLGPLAAIIGGIGGALAPSVGQMAMRSAPVQAMLRDPLGTMTQVGRTIPGLLAQ